MSSASAPPPVNGCVSVTKTASRQAPGGPGTRARIHGRVTLTKMWVPICFYCLKCTKLLFKILRLICTKFDFGWGSAPDLAGGAYSAPTNPIAGFTGPTSKGREGKGT